MYRDITPNAPFLRWTDGLQVFMLGEHEQQCGTNWFDDWTAEQLDAIGLYRDADIASAASVPEGYRQTGIHVERVAGVPTFVREIVEIVPPSPPVTPALPISTRALTAKLRIQSGIDSLDASITLGVSRAERDGWAAKADAARIYLADPDNAPASPILEAEASVTGETMAVLCAKIADQATSYMAISGQMAGIRRVASEAIDAAVAAEDAGAIEAALTTALGAISTASQAVGSGSSFPTVDKTDPEPW